jgi:hypothetical protein
MAHQGRHPRRGGGLTARSRLAAVAAVALVAVLGLAGCEPGRDTYVALGDSYSAGPIIPAQETTPAGCLRSTNNYPHLLFASTGLARLRDVSCSGATTEDFFAPQDVTPGPPNPPQLDAIDGRTRVVTFTISGNDIGFTGIVEECASATFAEPCRDTYVTPAGDEISRRIRETKADVYRVVTTIRRKAPQADVLVVGYPALLPDQGTGCYPVQPFLPEDVVYMRAKTKELNQMLRTVATNNGATYVDTYTPSIGHDMCSLPTVRWIEGLVPTTPAAPVHPNLLGMQGLSQIVGAAVRTALAD